MNTLETIQTRRSIRKFRSDPIPEDVLDNIFNAAVWAPSHRNSQPWEFVIIGTETRARLLALYQTVMEPVLSNPDLPEPARKGIMNLKEDFGGAPFMTAIMSRPPQDHLEKMENLPTAAVAVQNMCLAAWEQGIGSVWLSIGGHPAAGGILRVKEGYQVVAVLAMGYPEAIPPAPPRESYKNRLTSLP